MKFSELLKKRRSIRKFKNRPVETELLMEIAEGARRAPSAGNLQAYKIAIVRDRETIRQLGAAALHQECVTLAPTVMCFCADLARSARRYGARGRNLYAVQDATIACAYAQLKATELGLGTVWVGAFYEREVTKILELPEDLRPVALLSVGYPAEAPPPIPRRPLEELIYLR